LGLLTLDWVGYRCSGAAGAAPPRVLRRCRRGL